MSEITYNGISVETHRSFFRRILGEFSAGSSWGNSAKNSRDLENVLKEL